MLGRKYLKQKVIQNKNNDISSKFNMSNVEKKNSSQNGFSFLKMWHNKSMVKIRKICVRVTEKHLALPIELVLPTLKIYFHIVLQTGIWCLIFWLRFIQWIDEITYSNASNFKHKPLFLKFNSILTILQKQIPT